jgi:uncharacterized membrane protein
LPSSGKLLECAIVDEGRKAGTFVLVVIGAPIILSVLAVALNSLEVIVGLILLGLLLLVVMSIAAYASARRLKREAATKDELASLIRRTYALEQSLEKLREQLASRRAAEAEEKPAAPAAAPPQPAPSPAAPQPEVISQAALASPARPAATPPPRVAPGAFPQAAGARPRRRLMDVEELLGVNLAAKAGVALLVIGLAYGTKLLIERVGPGGKAAVLYSLSVALLAGGVWAERKQRYRLLARAAIGGGWALAYFSTYAIHNVPEVKLVHSAVLGFFLLFLVAAGMVVHSLRYASQVVTGIAYLLAFSTVVVSEIHVSALAATALLAASLAAIMARRGWYALEPGAIAVTYSVHLYWLFTIYQNFGYKRFPEFPASVALVFSYWAIFTVSHFLRAEREQGQRILLTCSFALNAALFLVTMRRQSFLPEWRFWFLLGVGLAYLALCAFLRLRGRRLGFVLTSTLGGSLTLAAVPSHQKLTGARLEFIWLAEAQAFLFAGWRLAERHLRHIGWAALGALATYVAFHDLSPRVARWAPPDWQTALMLAVIAAAFYLNARWGPRMAAGDESETEKACVKASEGIGSLFVVMAAWLALPLMWVAPAWAALALIFGESGRRRDRPALRAAGHAAALLGAARLLAINFQFAPMVAGLSIRLVTSALACALLYICARRIRLHFERPGGEAEAPAGGYYVLARGAGRDAYTWSASLLLALLLWHELATNAAAGVGLAWGLLGLALVEFGRGIGDAMLRRQGLALLALSFLRMMVADLNAERAVLGPLSARLLTVSVLAAIFYYVAATAHREERGARMAGVWCGTIALLSLARFELPTVWVAVGWAALSGLLYLGGWRLEAYGGDAAWQAGGAMGRSLRYQSYLVALLAALRCAFDNFLQTRPYFSAESLDWLNERSLTITLASALFCAVLATALRAPRAAAPAAEEFSGIGGRMARALRALDRNAHQLFFFIPGVLMTVLIGLEVKKSYVTAAWALEGFLIFAAVLKLGQRTFRWFSLALLMLCVGRIVAVDFQTFDQLGRIITFIGLGLALLAVSFLYARFKELWLKYM